MEVHQIRYFCAVARTRNFTRAAQGEHVAQPSLSQQILKLEEELGAKLFDRLGREIRLTEAGRRFLPKAQLLLKQLADAKHEILELSGAAKGDIKIGVIPTIAPFYLPLRIAAFAKRYPQVNLRVIEDVTTALLEGLREGTLDLAIVALPLNGKEYACHEVGCEPLYAVLPDWHPLATRNSIHVKQLEKEAFLLLKEGHCFRETVVAACRKVRMPLRTVFESGQFATILAMVAAGAGVSIVSAMAVQKTPGCRFLRLDDPEAHRRFGVAHLSQHYLSKAQSELLAELMKNRPVCNSEAA